MTKRAGWLVLVVSMLAVACSAGGLGGGGGTLSDMLALVPADEEFVITVGDLDAHRAAVGIPAPAADASDDELTRHLEALLLAGDDQLAAAGTTLGFHDQSGTLLPLARGSAYVIDRSDTEVIRGDFAGDEFGEPEEDDGLERVPLESGYGLVVEDGTVTIASERDHLDAALAAQHGNAESMADIPAATQLVAGLDELDVIHATAFRFIHGRTVDAVASGVADDPDSDRMWRLVVAYRPSTEGDLDAVTSTLERLADEYAVISDAEVLEVAPRGDVATATIRVDDPNLWLHLQRRFDPLLTGGANLSEPGDEPSS